MSDNSHLTKHIEEVEWVDSRVTSGWGEKVAEGVSEIKSVGYVVREVEDHIVLAESISCPGDTHPFGSQTSIPKSAITKRTVLRNRK